MKPNSGKLGPIYLILASKDGSEHDLFKSLSQVTQSTPKKYPKHLIFPKTPGPKAPNFSTYMALVYTILA